MPRASRDPSSALAVSRLARAQLGAAGELAAERHLLGLGFRILVRHHRCREGEIDLVAEEADCLCFVEVRTRRAGAIRPIETVGRRKQLRLYAAALDYLSRCAAAPRPLRFDVVEVHAAPGGTVSGIELWRNAFEAPEDD